MRFPLPVLLAVLLAGCSATTPKSGTPRPPVEQHARSAEVPVGMQRPAMPLTESAFLLPTERPTSHALGHSYLLLPWRASDESALHRQHVVCLGLRLALQQADLQLTATGGQLMPTYWPLADATGLQDCGRLVERHDYLRARQLLGSRLHQQPGPLLTAWSAEGNQLLVLDLSRFNDADIRRVLMFWVRELGSQPQYWNVQGFALPQIRQALAGYLQRYGQQVLSLGTGGNGNLLAGP